MKPTARKKGLFTPFQIPDLRNRRIGDLTVEIGVVRNIDALGHGLPARQHVDRSLRLDVGFRPRNRIIVIGFVRKRMIHLADADRLVAVRRKQLRQRHDIGIVASENSVECPHPGMIGTQAGEDAGPCRPAQRKLTIVVHKGYTGRRNTLESRSMRNPVPIRTDIGFEIVDHQKQDVRRGGGPLLPRRRGRLGCGGTDHRERSDAQKHFFQLCHCFFQFKSLFLFRSIRV